AKRAHGSPVATNGAREKRRGRTRALSPRRPACSVPAGSFRVIMDFLFRLDRIKEEPFVVEQEIASDELDGILEADPPTGFLARGPGRFFGTLVRVNEKDIVFEGRMPLGLRTSC